MNRAERRREARELDKLTPTPQGDRVAVGYIHPGEVSNSFTRSMLDLQLHELARTAMENNGAGYPLELISKGAGPGAIAHARNQVTEEFLAGSCDWLLFVDADMGFAPWVIQRMLGAARSDGFKPIIGGLCFALSRTGFDPETKAETYECFPTIGIWNRDEAGTILGYRTLTEYDRDTVLKVDATGAAMVLIHRSAFEKIGDRRWWSPLPVPHEVAGGADFFSEDISFFIRCAEHDIPVWLDTACLTSHDKRGVFLTQDLWEFQQEMKKAAADA